MSDPGNIRDFLISEEELRIARDFFSHNTIGVLTAQAIKFNKSQPCFSAVILALQRRGLPRMKSEDLLESIFVVYYAHTELRKKTIPRISAGQVMKNAIKFEAFFNFYDKERESGTADLSEIKFLRDEVVLNFAVRTLLDLFGDPARISNDVISGYFALLMAIENGAEKG